MKNILIALLSSILYLHACTHVAPIDGIAVVATLGMYAIVYGMCYFADESRKIRKKEKELEARLEAKKRELPNFTVGEEKGQAS